MAMLMGLLLLLHAAGQDGGTHTGVPALASGDTLTPAVMFPGYPWGTPRARIASGIPLDSVDRAGTVDRYRTGIERIGDAEIVECMFEFRGGRFVGLYFRTHGKRNTAQIHAYLDRRFGSVEETDPRFWQWIDGVTYVSLDEDLAGDGYILWYGIAWQEARQ